MRAAIGANRVEVLRGRAAEELAKAHPLSHPYWVAHQRVADAYIEGSGQASEGGMMSKDMAMPMHVVDKDMAGAPAH